jgi:transcriptional regulator with XRE-family HTH domain
MRDKAGDVAAEWDSLAGRLRWAIQQLPHAGRRRGLRYFQSMMAERAGELASGGPLDRLDGYTLSSIQTYLSGKRLPSLRFLQEAASILSVREAWLISHDGSPGEASADPGAASEALTRPAKDRMAAIEAAFERGAGIRLPLRTVLHPADPEPALIALRGLLRRGLASRPRARDIGLAEQLAEAVVAPLRDLEVDLDLLSPDFLEEHIIDMSPIIRRALEEEYDAKEA